MSVRLMGLVWEREMSHAQQAVLLALADHGQDDGTRIYPSYARLAWKSGYSRRQVKRLVLGLIKLGAIKRVRRGGPRAGTNSYRLNLEVFQLKKPLEGGDILTPPRTSEVVSPRPPRGDKTGLGGDIAMSPESPSESPYNHKKRARVIPKGSRASEPDKKRDRIREAIHDLRLTSYGRNPKAIAAAAGCSIEEAEGELGTLQ